MVIAVRLLTVAMLTLVCVLCAVPAHSTSAAVLAVDLVRDGALLPLQAADALRSAFAARGIVVLDAERTRRHIENRLHRVSTDVTLYRKRLDEADAALVASAPEQSLAVLGALISDLAIDPDFSSEKHTLLETARMKLALRLLGLAGKAESGKAETEFGKRARDLLVDALRVNPGISPSRSAYPPRFFVALEAARTALAARGTGGMRVASHPTGAAVYVEGRHFGQTPLALGDDVLPRGTYRVWVEARGTRSAPKLVHVNESGASVMVDLAFESALWAGGPGLRPMDGLSIDDAQARTAGQLLDVDYLVLVGTSTAEGPDAWLWAALFAVADARLVRHGAVRVNARHTMRDAAESLATFLERGDDRGISNRPLPASVLPRPPGVLAIKDDTTSLTDAGFPWASVGIVAGGVAALAAGAGIAWAVIAGTPRDGAMVVTLHPMAAAEP